MDMIKTMLQEKYDSRYNKSGKQAHQSPQDQHQLSGTKKQSKDIKLYQYNYKVCRHKMSLVRNVQCRSLIILGPASNTENKSMNKYSLQYQE